jgi:hypothetical protein
VKDVAHGTVVQDHDFAEVRLNLSKVLDVCAIAESAVLAVVAASKVLALDLQPVNDRIGVLLDRGREDNKIVPFRDLTLLSAPHLDHHKVASHLLQKLIAERSLVNVV